MKRRDFTLVGTSIAGTVLLGCADDLGDGDVDADGTGGMDGSSGGASSGGASSGGASSGGASSGGASSGGASTGGASSGGEVGSGGDESGSGGDESGSGGDESGSGGDESGTGGDESGTGGESGGSCSDADITEVDLHAHDLEMPIPQEDITAAVEKTYEIGGMHTHTITLTSADFAALEADGMVIVTSSSDNGHEHQVTLSCA